MNFVKFFVQLNVKDFLCVFLCLLFDLGILLSVLHTASPGDENDHWPNLLLCTVMNFVPFLIWLNVWESLSVLLCKFKNRQDDMIKFRFSKKFKIVKFDGRFCPFLMVKFKLRYNTCLFLSDSGSIRKNIKFQYYKRQYKIWPKCITVQCKTHYLYAFIFLMMCKLLEKMLSAPRAKQKNNLQIKVVINILTRRIGLGVGLVGWTREFRLEQMSDLYRTSSKDLGLRLK